MDRNEYDVIEFFGTTALFIDGRFSRENVPDGLYCYDLRGSDDDPGDPATVEHHVLVNHAGTILTAKPIEIPAQGYLPLGEGLNFITEVMTINEFWDKYASPGEVIPHQEQKRASDHPSQPLNPSIRGQLAAAKAEQMEKSAAQPISAKHTPESPWGYGRKWNLYIIADLKTWADNADNPTPLELFSSFEAAKARFEELRGKDYNSEAAEPGPDGQPPARLTLGIETADDMDGFDILCVHQGENYLVTDFTHLDRLRDDPVAMEIISRISHEIGFDYVRFFENDRGQTRLQPKIPFAEWSNSRFASSTPDSIFAKRYFPDRKASIRDQLAAAKAEQTEKPAVQQRQKDKEAR